MYNRFTEALILGMPPHLYWDDEPKLLDNYIEAEMIKNKKTMHQMDENAWLNGLYVYRGIRTALSQILSKDSREEYPNGPILSESKDDETIKDQKKIEEERETALLLAQFHGFGNVAKVLNSGKIDTEGNES